jgi:hypothetical protein
MVSTGINFAFTYMCTHFLHHLHSPTPFLPPTSSYWYQPSPWVKKKSVVLGLYASSPPPLWCYSSRKIGCVPWCLLIKVPVRLTERVFCSVFKVIIKPL